MNRHQDICDFDLSLVALEAGVWSLRKSSLALTNMNEVLANFGPAERKDEPDVEAQTNSSTHQERNRSQLQ